MLWMLGGMAYGPTPMPELARFVDAIPTELRPGFDRLPWRWANEIFVQGFAARLDEARAASKKARALAGELGLRVHEAGMSMFLAEVELAFGNPAEAERSLRDGFEQLGEMGETGFRSTVGTMLADALVDLDRDREAEEVLTVVDGLVVADDVDPQVRLRWVRARIHARRGELVEGERLAREAVAIAARTDYLVLHANALRALAEVLQLAGATGDVLPTLRQALQLDERKQNVPRAESTRARIHELEQSSSALASSAP
jgi:tetratricopeptide (TPR) repeat protein